MPEPSKTRVGVIGVGQIGKRHVATYAGMESVELVAIADIDAAEANAVAAQHGIPHVYTDFRKLLERDDIEAVDVCVHNNLHMPVTVAALKAGKHVFCEKPMAGAYTDAASMLATAQETGLHLSIQNIWYFNPETKAAKQLIDGGHLGEIYHARSTGYRRRGRPFVDGYGTPTFVQKCNSGGGALYDMGVYHISRILYLLGNPGVIRISGQTYQEIGMDPQRQAISGFDVEDLGLGFVRLAGNVTLDVIEAWAVNMDPFEGSAIFGNRGGVRFDPFSYHQSIGDLDLSATANLDYFQFRLRSVHGQGDSMDSPQQHWIAGLQGRVDLIPAAEIALNCMLISEGIYLSSQLGRELSADEVREISRSTAVVL